MKSNLGLTGTPDPKVKIYVETAYTIFELCFKKTDQCITEGKYITNDERKGKGNRFYSVANIMSQVIDENPITEEFLRNKNRDIENMRKKPAPYQLIGFDHHLIQTLSTFAGIDDYGVFDKQFGPVKSQPVLFWPKPFGWFNLIRVPRQGMLNELATGWEYIGDDKLTIKGSITEVTPYTMAGDRKPLWVEVKYTMPDGPQTGYFANLGNPRLETLTTENGLLRFFKRMMI